MAKVCTNCQKEIKRGRLCTACVNYRMRHGTMRPQELIERNRQRRDNPPTACANCGSPEISCGERCRKCYSYRLYHAGKERPLDLNKEPCQNCGISREDSGTGFTHHRCHRCANYLRTLGRERPSRLWGATKTREHLVVKRGPTQKLSDSITETYNFIIEYKKSNDGLSPTFADFREILGLSSNSVIYHRLRVLESIGRIKIIGSKSRHISVVGGQWIPPSA